MPPTADRYRLSHWVPLLVATGEFEQAQVAARATRRAARGRARSRPSSAATTHRGDGRARPVGGPASSTRSTEVDGAWRASATTAGAGSTPACCGSPRGPPPTRPRLARARRDPAGEARGAIARARRFAARARAPAGVPTRRAWAAGRGHARRARYGGRRGHAPATARPTRGVARTPASAGSALGRPYLLAYAGWREARRCLAAGDRAEAAAALREADAIATALGAQPAGRGHRVARRRARIDLPTR